LGKKNIIAVNRATNQRVSVGVDEVLVAVGRASNSDILKPERAGIKVDGKGWIQVNEYLETSVPNIWAFGDATGKHMFKHVANYESVVVYYNAILKKSMKADYHAVPHAVFTHPEIASVGLGEKEAIQKFGKENVLVGVARYEDTAKGMAMGVTGAFVKLLADRDSERLLGAHIIGPQASVLIQEVINLMYAPGGSVKPLKEAMHIHPALSEVVEHAAAALVPVELYYHMLEHRKEHQHDHAHGEGNGGGHQHEAASEGHDHGQGHAHGKGDGHSH
jgi:dihydrolipoamide dehydrogenase